MRELAKQSRPIIDTDTDPASYKPPSAAQSQCRACALAATRTRIAPVGGLHDAVLFVLEEAPSSTTITPHPCKRSFGTLAEFLSGRGVEQGTYSHGYCCACDTPSNRRPTRAELSSCSRWLSLSLSDIYRPHVILAVGATAASLFYRENTLSLAIERAALRGHRPQMSVVYREPLYVVPMPQIAALSSHRRSIDRRPWADIANEQLSIALELVRQQIQSSG